MRWLWARFVDHVVLWRGSTRAVSLIRIGLALILWSRWAPLLSPWSGAPASHVLLGVALLVGSGFMLIGLWTRLTMAFMAAVMLVQFYGFGVYLGVRGWDGHHTYLLVVMTVLLAMTPCGGSYSVDRLLAVRRARAAGVAPPEERGDLWGARLLALSVALVYFWSAYDKTHVGFLSGDRLEMIFSYHHFGADMPGPPFRALMTALAVTTVGLEYLLSFGLFVRRWRPWLVPVGLTMHALFYWLLPISTFTVEMALLYLAFLDPDRLHRVLDEVHGPAAGGTAAPVREADRAAS